MSANIKLQDDGKCNHCKRYSQPNEHVQSFICKENFHAVCPDTRNEVKVATKTTVINFLLDSTKRNFMFFCDICLTNFKISMAGTDDQRINLMESKMDTMDTQLTEIKNLLTTNGAQLAKEESPRRAEQQKSNYWVNIKVPPSPVVLILGTTNELVEQKIMENNIILQNTYQNKNGDLCIVCDSKESRDNLNNIVTNADANIPTKTPNMHPLINIVGLPKECTKYEISDVGETKRICNVVCNE